MKELSDNYKWNVISRHEPTSMLAGFKSYRLHV